MLCRLKVFLPILVWGCVVLMPINQTDNNLHSLYASNSTGENYTNYSKVDTVSIANIHDGSPRYVSGTETWSVFLTKLLFQLAVLGGNHELSCYYVCKCLTHFD